MHPPPQLPPNVGADPRRARRQNAAEVPKSERAGGVLREKQGMRWVGWRRRLCRKKEKKTIKKNCKNCSVPTGLLSDPATKAVPPIPAAVHPSTLHGNRTTADTAPPASMSSRRRYGSRGDQAPRRERGYFCKSPPRFSVFFFCNPPPQGGST